MIEPTEHDIGRKVIYRDFGGHGKIEEGTITSLNDLFVFVRYTTGSTSAATRRSDLDWPNRTPEQTAIATTVQFVSGRWRTNSIDFYEPPTRPA